MHISLSKIHNGTSKANICTQMVHIMTILGHKKLPKFVHQFSLGLYPLKKYSFAPKGFIMVPHGYILEPKSAY